MVRKILFFIPETKFLAFFPETITIYLKPSQNSHQSLVI